MEFSKDVIKAVWENARAIDGYNPSLFRQDPCGAWIVFNKYGLRDNAYGWEIDHVYPVALGGDENIQNLRAMHWKNNASKADDYPSYISRVTSEGNHNKECYDSRTVNLSLREKLQNIYNK